MGRQSVLCDLDMVAYLEAIAASLQQSSGVDIELGVGDMVAFNNRFVLHGRSAFEAAGPFERLLLRTRGYFERAS